MTRSISRSITPPIVCCVLASAILTLVIRRAYYQLSTMSEVIGGPLPDRLHSFLPEFPLPELADIIVFGILILVPSVVVFYRAPIKVVIPLLYTIAIITFIRACVVFGTTFALPNAQCMSEKSLDWGGISYIFHFITFGLLPSCSEAMYSSRVAASVLTVTAVRSIIPTTAPSLLRNGLLVIPPVLWLILLCSRRVYTVDVIVTAYTSLCVWHLCNKASARFYAQYSNERRHPSRSQ